MNEGSSYDADRIAEDVQQRAETGNHPRSSG